MTFKSKLDLKIKLQFAAVVLGAVLLLGAFFLDHNMLALIVSVPLLLTVLTVGWQMKNTHYTVGETLLEAKSGLSHLTLDYNSISKVTDQKDLCADGYVPFALAAPPLYIYYIQEKKTYRLELSPQDRAGFLQALEERLGTTMPDI